MRWPTCWKRHNGGEGEEGCTTCTTQPPTKDLQHIGYKNYIKHKSRTPTLRFSYNPIAYPLKRILNARSIYAKTPNWRLRPRRSVIQTSLVIKAARRREESGDRHLHHLIFFNFKATLRLRLIKQYQLIRPCPQATCVFFQSSSYITIAQWIAATTKFYILCCISASFNVL